MEVNITVNASINNNQPATNASKPADNNKSTTVVVQNNIIIANEAAVFEKSKPEKFKPDAKRVQELLDQTNRATELLRQLVERLLTKQGTTAMEALGIILGGGEFRLEIDDETRQKALDAIGEDGYFGVAQTSQRILDFAKALSGGDPSKIDLLRDAVMKGFERAEELWGGKLPEISYQTLDAVMKGFEEWRESAK